MKTMNLSSRLIPIFLAGALLFASCKSVTMINSEPPGASLFIDNQYVGATPYQHVDDKISFSTTMVRMEMDGYEPLVTTFSRDEQIDPGAIIGGLLFWFPFLWTFKYDPSHTYTMIPANYYYELPPSMPEPVVQPESSVQSKADQLRELKKLLDEGIITQDEFDQEKKKILN
jgi:hypothetical protein